MPHKLKIEKVHELSVIFGEKAGKQWAPRNPEAKVLGVKAGETKPSGFLGKLFEKMKAAGFGFPVSSEVPDNIDNDGDGADDYNEIVGLVCNLAYDIQACYGIMDDEARSAAICCAIDNFIECLDDLRAGKDDDDEKAGLKAGARHSQADMERLNALSDLTKQMSDAATQAAAHLRELGVGASELEEGREGEDPKDDDKNPGATNDADKAKRKDDAGKEGDKYGDVEYADTANKKYPIDSEEHVRAAWSYINMPKNAKFYDADELAKIKDRIRAAGKKYDIEFKDEDDKKASELDMTQEQLDAVIAKAAEAAAQKATESVRAELQPQIDAAKATADAANAERDAAKAQAATAEAERIAAESAKAAAEKKTIEEARSVSGSSPAGDSEVNKARQARPARPALLAAVKGAMGDNPDPTRF